MNRILNLTIKIFLIFGLFTFFSHKAYADETESILKQLEILQEDIKTLEKAVYSEGVKTTSQQQVEAQVGQMDRLARIKANAIKNS